MEPMTLGSPVGSPMSSSSNVLPAASSSTASAATISFLPGFLMGGETQSQTSSARAAQGGVSPGRATRTFSSSTSLSSPGSPQPTKEPFFSATRLGGERAGGPPTFGLMGSPSMPQHQSASKHSSPFIDHHRILGTPLGTGGGSPHTPVMYGSPHTPHHNTGIHLSRSAYNTPINEPSFIASESQLDNSCCDSFEDTWVTVFGFPAASSSYILTQFAQLGTIIEQRNLGSGNWMHLKYQTKLQARKALSKNGKIYSGNIMVGVLPYIEKDMGGDKENINISLNTSNIYSPCNTSSITTPKANIRPLTQAYQTAHAENEVVPKTNTPKKSDGFVSRAMQHILGI